MIPDISQEMLDKINSPIQLRSSNNDPWFKVIAMNDSMPIPVDVTHLVESGSVSSKNDDYVYTTTLNILSQGSGENSQNLTFKPGTKIQVFIGYGSDTVNALQIAFCHVDEVNWTRGDKTYTVSGRNNTGYLLKGTQMGEKITATGLSHEVASEILEYAGINDYIVTIGTYSKTYTYKASDTAYSALELLCKEFPIIRETVPEPLPGFRIIEAPSGRVGVGYPREITQTIPVGTYDFTLNKDVFSRSFRLTGDECYSYVYANGKTEEGVDLKQVIVPVENHQYWVIPENKIYFADFDGATNQITLSEWAERVAMELKNMGDTEDFSGPFRPQLTPGDIAVIHGSDWAKTGVMTSIIHKFGQSGFTTDFTVDSGGVFNAQTGWTSTMWALGFNRRQKLPDLVHEVAERVTEQALSAHDPIVVEEQQYEEEYDEATQETVEVPIKTPDEKNTVKIIYDGRNWADLVYATGGSVAP